MLFLLRLSGSQKYGLFNFFCCCWNYIHAVPVSTPACTSENTGAGTRDADETGTAETTIPNGFIHPLQYATTIYARLTNAALTVLHFLFTFLKPKSKGATIMWWIIKAHKFGNIFLACCSDLISSLRYAVPWSVNRWQENISANHVLSYCSTEVCHSVAKITVIHILSSV